MSAYYEVAEELASSDTLVAEMGQAYERWIGVRRGDMVPLLEVAHSVKANKKELRVLYEMGPKTRIQDLKLAPLLNRDGQLRLVTVEFLRTWVLKMRTNQARELLESAVMLFHDAHYSHNHTEQMIMMMNEMSEDVKQVRREVVDIPDSSSDSECEEGVRHALSAAATAAQRKYDQERRSAFAGDVEKARVTLHHSRLWIGEDTMAHQRVFIGHGEDARPKTSSAALGRMGHVDESDIDEADELEMTLEEVYEKNTHLEHR